MIAQWENKCVSLYVLPVAWPWRSISSDFSLADHALPTGPEPAGKSGSISPLNGTTQPVDIKEKGLHLATDRQ